MVWLYLGFIVAVIAIIIICRDEDNYLDEKIGYSCAAFILSMIASVVLLLTSSAIVSSCAEMKYHVVSDTKIIALKDNQNINGNCYIMGGYVGEDLYYYYTTETEFGYKTEKIKAENAYIKYTDEEPHIEKYKGEFANDAVNFWAAPMCTERCIIYCPEGTVTNEFNIDLE